MSFVWLVHHMLLLVLCRIVSTATTRTIIAVSLTLGFFSFFGETNMMMVNHQNHLSLHSIHQNKRKKNLSPKPRTKNGRKERRQHNRESKHQKKKFVAHVMGQTRPNINAQSVIWKLKPICYLQCHKNFRPWIKRNIYAMECIEHISIWFSSQRKNISIWFSI